VSERRKMPCPGAAAPSGAEDKSFPLQISLWAFLKLILDLQVFSGLIRLSQWLGLLSPALENCQEANIMVSPVGSSCGPVSFPSGSNQPPFTYCGPKLTPQQLRSLRQAVAGAALTNVTVTLESSRGSLGPQAALNLQGTDSNGKAVSLKAMGVNPGSESGAIQRAIDNLASGDVERQSTRATNISVAFEGEQLSPSQQQAVSFFLQQQGFSGNVTANLQFESGFLGYQAKLEVSGSINGEQVTQQYSGVSPESHEIALNRALRPN
jgi:hypothetical protein